MSATRNHFASPINMMVRDKTYESASFYDFDRFDIYRLQNTLFGDRTRKINNISNVLKGISKPKPREAKEDFTVINVEEDRFGDLCLDTDFYTLASKMTKKQKKEKTKSGAKAEKGEKPSKPKKSKSAAKKSRKSTDDNSEEKKHDEVILGFNEEESEIILTAHNSMLENIDQTDQDTTEFSSSGIKDRSLERLSAADKKKIVKKLAPQLQSAYCILKNFVEASFDPSDSSLSDIEKYDVAFHLLLSNNISEYFGKANACESLYQESQHLLYDMLLFSATGDYNDRADGDGSDRDDGGGDDGGRDDGADRFDGANDVLDGADLFDDDGGMLESTGVIEEIDGENSEEEVRPKKKSGSKSKRKPTKKESDDEDEDDDDDN